MGNRLAKNTFETPAGVAIAAIAVAAGAGLVGAPPAAADRAAASAESAYVDQLTAAGVSVPATGQRRDLMIMMGYLTCKLVDAGGTVQPENQVYFTAARNNGLCGPVSTGPTDAERAELKRKIQDALDTSNALSPSSQLTVTGWALLG
jgi:hypothetical protein